MRVFLLFAAVVGLACGAAVHRGPKFEKLQRFPASPSNRDLQDDLNDFLALIPVDEIVNIVLNYVANDAEVQAALQYLMSDEFESIVVYIDQQAEVLELLNFLEDSGLAIYDFLNMIHDFLGIPQIERPASTASRMRRSSRSLKSMLDEILAVLPVDDLKALYNEKLETSPDFAELIARLSSDEFHQLVLRVGELDAVQELIQMLRDAGIDVDAIADFIRNLFGWASSSKVKPFIAIKKIQRFPAKMSNRDLQDDLNDFLALIPVDEIVNIVLTYVANDAEVQSALQYLMSDEFESIVVYIDQQPELYELLNFLEDSGLDPYGLLNRIHDFLGIPQIERPASRMRRSSRSLKSMLDEILAVLPVDDLKALYNEKLETSPDFAELISRLSSDEFHQLVLRVGELDAVQELIQKLRDAGIDVDAIADFIRNLFGWASPSKAKPFIAIKKIQRLPAKISNRDLQDDLNDFLALIPVDEIVNIVLTYVANDAEVQSALQYLMSDEFESIVVYIDQQPELYELLNFLEDSGLDPYGLLNRIHDFLGIPQIERPASRMRRSSRSLKSMLDEILAVLPVDDLKALYNEKLETSPDFAELISRLSSDEFHQLVLRVGELDAVQELIQKLRDAGIDVDAIADFIRNLFGWASPSKAKPFIAIKKIQRFPAKISNRDLQDDLNDFLALIPVDEIVNIVLNYVANDAEVQSALQYLMSDEFESIVVYIDQQPELYDLLNFLEESGLDPYGFLNMIHDFLGIPPIEKPASRMRRSSRSLKSMLDEILAVLPVDDLRALYNEKLETSPDFAELIARLSSDEFHQLVLRVGELDAVQELIQKLRDAGIDVDAIADFIRKIFGWAS